LPQAVGCSAADVLRGDGSCSLQPAGSGARARRARHGRALMPHAQYVAVAILVDGQVRAAQAFNCQTDALRWAEEQRVIHALEAR
jgi:hypothetical protein